MYLYLYIFILVCLLFLSLVSRILDTFSKCFQQLCSTFYSFKFKVSRVQILFWKQSFDAFESRYFLKIVLRFFTLNTSSLNLSFSCNFVKIHFIKKYLRYFQILVKQSKELTCVNVGMSVKYSRPSRSVLQIVMQSHCLSNTLSMYLKIAMAYRKRTCKVSKKGKQ